MEEKKSQCFKGHTEKETIAAMQMSKLIYEIMFSSGGEVGMAIRSTQIML